MNASPLVIALTKGRTLDESLEVLSRIGVQPAEPVGSSRKLVFDSSWPSVKLMLLRGHDVPTYVRHGVADLGISGKDVLLEHGGEGYYEPLDLGTGKCRLMTAGLAEGPPLPGRIKVATKFVRVAGSYFATRGVQADVIRLYGGMELAAVTGLAHLIVDIVDTGRTLKANGLVPLALIADISTRVIVNPASMKQRHRQIQELLDLLEKAVS